MSTEVEEIYDLSSITPIVMVFLGTLVLLFSYQLITTPGLPKITLFIVITAGVWILMYFLALKIFQQNTIKIRSTLRKNYQISLVMSEENFERAVPATIRSYAKRYLIENIIVLVFTTVAIYLLITATGYLTTLALVIIFVVMLFFYRNFGDNPVTAHYQGQVDPRVSATGQKELS